ncbi:hypothetical protein D9613_001482 [Agrocybe pediades]|uniref:Uncharacterized protein n=1 Tax=Agrocybe pediades TaxID=84607 RepID=A0A8H4R546_9AGAR|nr:hypothetical protein D9613_001482 [Agrocybe pediades]
MYEHASKLLRDSGISMPKDNSASSATILSQKRFHDIMATLDEKSDAVSMDELIPILLQHDTAKDTLAVKERDGFVWLLRGYCADESVEALRNKLPCPPAVSVKQVYNASITNEANGDILDKLLMRESIMLQCEQAGSLASFVASVLRSIQCIYFAREWSNLRKKQKRDFVNKAFSHHESAFLAKTDNATRIAKKKQAFKSRHAKVIASRNELWRIITLQF